MHFAVFETGGKQYKVAEGDVVAIEKMLEVKEGEKKVVFDKVLLKDDGASTMVGTPYLDGATIEAEITEEGRARKISVMKFKSKSNYFKNKGHRQPFMKVKILSIK